jgi:hypothetical protein
MKPAAGLAEYGFIGAVRTVRCGFIREPVLHVHAATGTFEDEAIHPVCQCNDWTVFRIDPCQCQTAQGVQPFGQIDRFLDKIRARHSASRRAATMIDGFLSRNAPAP